MDFDQAVWEFAKYIVQMLNQENWQAISFWISDNLFSPYDDTPLNVIAAFFTAEKLIFAEFIRRNNLDSMRMLLKASNRLADQKLQTYTMKLLFKAFIDSENFLFNNPKSVNDEYHELIVKQMAYITDGNLRDKVKYTFEMVEKLLAN